MAVNDHFIYVLNPKPGIQRDGTQLDSDGYCIDGQWVRWYKGRAKKIGGYQLLDSGNTEIIRNIFEVPKDNSVDLYLGRPSSLKVINVNFNFSVSTEVDRTPLTGFTPNVNNQWSFDLFTLDVEGTPTTYIIAQVSPNSLDISGTDTGPVFYGDINSTEPLTPLPSPQDCSGGVVVVSPYLFLYGNDGIVEWTNDLSNWSNADLSWVASTPATKLLKVSTSTGGLAAISGTKIVAGKRTRGGGAPAVLFWSTNSLIRGTFSPSQDDPNGFAFDTIRDDISIIASDCIIEYDQMYFWPGNGAFYFYNGVVQVLPNAMNSNFFYNNYNFNYRERIFGMAIPRWKELWWPFPLGNSTENNHALIYNVELQVWYDTPLFRSCGVSAQIYPYPIMCDTIPNNITGAYGVWMHEIGTDKVQFNIPIAIPSYFETNIMMLADQNPQMDLQTRIRRIEPDFVQSGSMSVTIKKRAFANSTVSLVGPFVFDSTIPNINLDGINNTMGSAMGSAMGRQYSFVFTSNEAGGNYHMGKIYINWVPGDVTPNS